MGEENNQCKAKHIKNTFAHEQKTEKSGTSQRSKMAPLSNIYIGVIGVPLALDNQ